MDKAKNTANNFDFFNVNNRQNQIDNNRSNDFEYDEIINAAYINFNKKYKKINIQFGLRIENTDSKGTLTAMQTSNNNVVERNYTDWFPSAGITFTPNRKNSWL